MQVDLLIVSGSFTGNTPLTSPLTRIVHASYTPLTCLN